MGHYPLEETPESCLEAPKADLPSHTADCLQQREAELSGPAGTHDKRQEFEEPYDGKLSRTVLKPSGGGDPVA